MKKIATVCMTVLLVMGSMGVGYAYWSDGMTIEARMTTAEGGGGSDDEIPTGEGLSHGYWKNHEEAWELYIPAAAIGSVFDLNEILSDTTFHEALRFGGGAGVGGAAESLLKQAIGSVLNATSPNVDFYFSDTEVINMVNAALATSNRDKILALADKLDAYNNLGVS